MIKTQFLIFLGFFVLGLTMAQTSTTPGGTTVTGTGATGTGAACQDYTTDCAINSDECTNPVYKPLMCGLCKKTCQFCPPFNGTDPCAGVVPATTPPPTPAPGDCTDVDPNCPNESEECNNPLYHDLVCKYCRIRLAVFFAFLAVVIVGIQINKESEIEDLTFDELADTTDTPDNSSSDGGCEDYSDDCAINSEECTNPIYKPLMCGLCKKTCDFCTDGNGTDPCAGIIPATTPPTTPGPGDCVDVDPNCASESAECTEALYHSLMCKYCRKTCNICNCAGGKKFTYNSSYAEEKFIIKYGFRLE
ncbi:hypothetical protein FO519_002602 [Halicephalobus sp. NKZ332]|nr:hypothetical protein FO519_002602 [Halicephalobus sp. NKZ332]